MVIAYFPVFHRSVLFASSCLVTKSRKLTNDFTLGAVIPKTITRRVIVLYTFEIHSALFDYDGRSKSLEGG